MKTVQLVADHLPSIREGFDAMREERKANYVDYLADPRILDFHFDRLAHRLQASNSPDTLFGFLDGEKVLGLAGIEPSTLHTECYETPVYKIQPFFCFAKTKEELRIVAQALWRKCRNSNVSAYMGRTEANHPHLAYVMSEAGFIHSGSSVRMIAYPELEKKVVDDSGDALYDNVRVRLFDPADLQAIQEIGKASHKHSHFFAELRFSRERTQELFSQWIRRCVGGFADTVFVAEANGKPVGFCTLLVNSSLHSYIQKTVGIIDFIAVDPSAQGQGVGAKLLQAAMRRFSGLADRIELRTMLDNIRAIRFYERRGFTFLASDHHFHLWSGPPETLL